MRIEFPPKARVIRRARSDDAAALAPLALQLGYPSTSSEVAARLAAILADPDQVVFVAEAAGKVIGWIQGAIFVTVESDPSVEILGLVVGEGHRGGGVGRELLALAESWARRRDIRQMSLRSNVIRTGAHAFYQRLGYSIIKSQHAFRKTLD